jgi:hypothetical protein
LSVERRASSIEKKERKGYTEEFRRTAEVHREEASRKGAKTQRKNAKEIR